MRHSQKYDISKQKVENIPPATKPTSNIPSVEKSAERVTDRYNAEEVEYFTEVVRENLDYWHLGDWLCQDGRDGYAEAHTQRSGIPQSSRCSKPIIYGQFSLFSKGWYRYRSVSPSISDVRSEVLWRFIDSAEILCYN